MRLIAQATHDTLDVLEFQERIARVTGILYLVIGVLGMFSPIALQTLVVPGDAATTADNILGSRWLFGSSLVTWAVLVVADAAVSVTLYLLLEPASRALSLVAAALRLVYSAVLGALVLNLYNAFLLLTSVERGAGLDAQQRHAMALSSLATFSTGFLIALVFFGVHLVVLGFALYRSRYVPRALGVLIVTAGSGYIVDSLAHFFVADYGGLVRAFLLTPAVVGELGLTAWLLAKGVKVRPEAVTNPPIAGATGNTP